jgi:hypothetical protein
MEDCSAVNRSSSPAYARPYGTSHYEPHSTYSAMGQECETGLPSPRQSPEPYGGFAPGGMEPAGYPFPSVYPGGMAREEQGNRSYDRSVEAYPYDSYFHETSRPEQHPIPLPECTPFVFTPANEIDSYYAPRASHLPLPGAFTWSQPYSTTSTSTYEPNYTTSLHPDPLIASPTPRRIVLPTFQLSDLLSSRSAPNSPNSFYPPMTFHEQAPLSRPRLHHSRSHSHIGRPYPVVHPSLMNGSSGARGTSGFLSHKLVEHLGRATFETTVRYGHGTPPVGVSG